MVFMVTVGTGVCNANLYIMNSDVFIKLKRLNLLICGDTQSKINFFSNVLCVHVLLFFPLLHCSSGKLWISALFLVHSREETHLLVPCCSCVWWRLFKIRWDGHGTCQRKQSNAIG